MNVKDFLNSLEEKQAYIDGKALHDKEMTDLDIARQNAINAINVKYYSLMSAKSTEFAKKYKSQPSCNHSIALHFTGYGTSAEYCLECGELLTWAHKREYTIEVDEEPKKETIANYRELLKAEFLKIHTENPKLAVEEILSVIKANNKELQE